MEFLKKFNNEKDYELALEQLDQFVKDDDFSNKEDLIAFNKLANLVNEYEEYLKVVEEKSKNYVCQNWGKEPSCWKVPEINKKELKDFLLNAMAECEKEPDDNYYRGKYNALKAVYLCFIKENI